MKRSLIIIVLASLIFATEGIQDHQIDLVQDLKNDIQKTDQLLVSRSHMRPPVAKFLAKDDETLDQEFFIFSLLRGVPKSVSVGVVKNVVKSGIREIPETIKIPNIRPQVFPEVPKLLGDIKPIEVLNYQTMQKFQSLAKHIESNVFLAEKNVMVDSISLKDLKLDTRFSSSDFVLPEGRTFIAENINQPIFLAIDEQINVDLMAIDHLYELKPKALKSHGIQDILDDSLKTFNKKLNITKVYLLAAPAGLATPAMGVLFVGHQPQQSIDK